MPRDHPLIVKISFCIYKNILTITKKGLKHPNLDPRLSQAVTKLQLLPLTHAQQNQHIGRLTAGFVHIDDSQPNTLAQSELFEADSACHRRCIADHVTRPACRCRVYIRRRRSTFMHPVRGWGSNIHPAPPLGNNNTKIRPRQFQTQNRNNQSIKA